MSRDSMTMHNPRFSATSSPHDDQFSQAAVRTYAIFTDQFGREWGAVVERKTMHPCGAMSPKFAAPIYPPQKYLRITDTLRFRCFVDLDRWLADLEREHTDYRDAVIREAQRLFTDQYHTAYVELGDGRVKATNAALLHRVGRAPEPFEMVVAMKAKNRWILGLANPDGSRPERPKHPLVDELFPVRVKVRVTDPFTGEVTEDPFATDSGETQPAAEDPFADTGGFEARAAYPFMYAPGRWDLSEAEHRARLAGSAEAFRGTKDEALEEIERRRELAVLSGKSHESWG